MKFTNCPELAYRIQIMCVLDSSDETRIINNTVELPKEKTAEEKKIERFGEEISQLFVIKDDTATFDAGKKYSQMHSTNTINYIDFAIQKVYNEKGIKNFVIVIHNVSILQNVIEVLADVIIKYKELGIDVQADLDSEEAITDLGLFIHRATAKDYDEKAKLQAILQNIQPNTAGMLIKYKKSRALDCFGRHGKGEVVSSRIAIFRGIKRDQDGTAPRFVVESYNDETFYTKQHWMYEHDNEIPERLKAETTEITMEELGFDNMFLGTSYHFLEPIQQKVSENRTVIVDLDDEQKPVRKTCTIPERMQLVFDDWDIKYNKEELEKAIKTTREQLKLDEK
jgi:hypothetical protein